MAYTTNLSTTRLVGDYKLESFVVFEYECNFVWLRNRLALNSTLVIDMVRLPKEVVAIARVNVDDLTSRCHCSIWHADRLEELLLRDKFIND